MKVPLEYQSSSLEFLNAFLNGLAYMCILEILKLSAQGKMTQDDFASLEQEISKNFFIVRDILKGNKTLNHLFSYLLDDITGAYYENGISALWAMAKSFEDKHNQAKSKGFNGIQIAYMQEAQRLLAAAGKESFSQKQQIQAKFSFLPKMTDEAVLLNNEVFKAQVPPREQLTHIKPLEHKVRPIEPKNIRIPPKDAEYFESFRSEEMETVRSSLTLFVSNKKEHVQKTLFDLKENLLDMGGKYNLPFLKICTNVGEAVINDEFKKKVTTIREVGEGGYNSLLNKVMQFKGEIEQSFKKIDAMVDEECQKDKQAIAQVQNGNYATFVNAFGDHLNTVNSVKSSYRNYRAIEERIVKAHEQHKFLLPKVADKNTQIQDLLKAPDLDQFVAEHKDTLLQIKKLADGLDKLINSYLTEQEKDIVKALEGINVEKLTEKILMNEKTCEAIFSEINESIGPKVIQFEEKASQVLVPMGKISELGDKVSHGNPAILQNNPLNAVLMAIDFYFVGNFNYRNASQS